MVATRPRPRHPYTASLRVETSLDSLPFTSRLVVATPYRAPTRTPFASQRTRLSPARTRPCSSLPSATHTEPRVTGPHLVSCPRHSFFSHLTTRDPTSFTARHAPRALPPSHTRSSRIATMPLPRPIPTPAHARPAPQHHRPGSSVPRKSAGLPLSSLSSLDWRAEVALLDALPRSLPASAMTSCRGAGVSGGVVIADQVVRRGQAASTNDFMEARRREVDVQELVDSSKGKRGGRGELRLCWTRTVFGAEELTRSSHDGPAARLRLCPVPLRRAPA